MQFTGFELRCSLANDRLTALTPHHRPNNESAETVKYPPARESLTVARTWTVVCLTVLAVMNSGVVFAESASDGSRLSKVLAAENGELGVSAKPMSLVDDTAYLRRVSVDLIGRIPNHQEIQEYLAWPAA
jgi:hypothetical protein